MTTHVDAAGPGRLAKLAYHHVRAEILAQRMPAGTVLNEGAIAEALGISKTPVQHALRTLRHEGLLEVGPRRQLVVREVPALQRSELLEVREALERIAVTHACRSMGDDDFDHLHILLRRQRRFAEGDQRDDFVDCDEEMHLAIAAGSGLQIVPHLLGQLRGFVALMQMNARRDPGHLFQVLKEHSRLVAAIEGRNEEEAITALLQHLRTSEYMTGD